MTNETELPPGYHIDLASGDTWGIYASRGILNASHPYTEDGYRMAAAFAWGHYRRGETDGGVIPLTDWKARAEKTEALLSEAMDELDNSPFERQQDMYDRIRKHLEEVKP